MHNRHARPTLDLVATRLLERNAPPPAALTPGEVVGEELGLAPLDRLLELKQVLAITTLSRSCLYRDVFKGLFPAPIKIGKSRIAWRASEVAAWIAKQPKVTPRAA